MRWCYACGDVIKGRGLLLERFGTLRDYCMDCGRAVGEGRECIQARSVGAERRGEVSDAQEKKEGAE